MVRVNLVNPKDLTDEHLFAERVELLMLQTFINKYPTGYIPSNYTLGKGHMSFFRDKTLFVKDRLNLVLDEIDDRINVEKKFELKFNYVSEYIPDSIDIEMNKARIIDRLLHPKKKTNHWHYYGQEILDIKEFISFHYNVGKLCTFCGKVLRDGDNENSCTECE